eukprot:TRINITY_DN3116_c0_g1_i2.p1 TRINITY_DN3116_c0_g1~~TRINITY_DN3116_c0_g1_i2.p1  ORF type:complete len:549 (+),score=175.74 TRINITY_DN3116_c0_g1_i2:65-1648(+)
MATFKAPVIHDNPEGWGPSTLPAKYRDMPFANFSKSDRLGKAADWLSHQKRDGRDHHHNNVADEEESFRLVDNRVQSKPKFLGRRTYQPRVQSRGAWGRQKDDQNPNRKGQAGSLNKRWNKWGPGWRDWNRPESRNREWSLDVKPEWEVLQQVNFSALSRLHADVADPEDLVTAGEIEYYDKGYDRVTVRNEKPLKRSDERVFYKLTTSDDPIIKKLAEDNTATVYATDAILSVIMGCTRSANSWDIVVNRVGDNLFLDKRDNTSFDYDSCHETGTIALPEDPESINNAENLSREATFINQHFSQQVLKKDGKKFKFDKPNPFKNEGEDIASVGYRYRKWDLGDDVTLVARTEIDAVTEYKEDTNFLTVRALNEFDPKISGVDWRKKLDSQRGAVVATELKNNSFKLAKWTLQALLAGSHQLRIGYVSRDSPKDSYKHTILGTELFKVREFAGQTNLSISNAWGILKHVVDMCLELNEGKYVLLKDPAQTIIRLYKVPEDAFDSDDEMDDDDDDVDDDGSDIGSDSN